MSWGNSASGTAAQMNEQAARFAEQVKKSDANDNATPATIQAPEAQAKAAAAGPSARAPGSSTQSIRLIEPEAR